MSWVLNDPPPKFGAELAECQRYQIVLAAPCDIWKDVGFGVASSSTVVFMMIPTPVTLRANPEVEFGGNDWYLESGPDSVQVTNITKNVFSANSAQIMVSTAGGLIVGKLYFLVKRDIVSPDTKLILNCNL